MEEKMFEIEKKVGLAVYLYYNRDVRKVAKLGQMIYHSRRLRYVILYVEQSQVDKIKENLEQQRFVKAVQPSQLDNINHEFVGSLQS